MSISSSSGSVTAIVPPPSTSLISTSPGSTVSGASPPNPVSPLAL